MLMIVLCEKGSTTREKNRYVPPTISTSYSMTILSSSSASVLNKALIVVLRKYFPFVKRLCPLRRYQRSFHHIGFVFFSILMSFSLSHDGAPGVESHAPSALKMVVAPFLVTQRSSRERLCVYGGFLDFTPLIELLIHLFLFTLEMVCQ